jgi:hypothetical protein
MELLLRLLLPEIPEAAEICQPSRPEKPKALERIVVTGRIGSRILPWSQQSAE